MKFEIGEKIVIKDDLGTNDTVGVNLFAEEMSWLRGEILTIVDYSGVGSYIVKESKYGILDCMIDHNKTIAIQDKLEIENEVQSWTDIHGKTFYSYRNTHDENSEQVDHPSHYNQGKYEVIDVIEDWRLDFHLANAIKYIARAEHKGKFEEDIKKAIWYLERRLKNDK